MELLSILLLTLAATADSFTIGFNYGVRQVHITNTSNLFISLLCLLGTAAAMFAGKLLGATFSNGPADLIGSAALLVFGLYMLWQALRPAKEDHFASDPSRIDRNHSNTIEPGEAALAGVLLSLNNMGLGVGAGMAGVSPVATSLLCAAASFLFIRAGCSLGGSITQPGLSKGLELLSALLVLVLGVTGFVRGG